MTQLGQAIELARSGDKAAACELLGQIIKQDSGNEVAWGWLAHCVTTKDEKIYCLRRVVEINPANIKAQVALEKLSQPQPTPPDQPTQAPTPLEKLRKAQLTPPAQPVPERGAPAQPAQIVQPTQKAQKRSGCTYFLLFLIAAISILSLVSGVFSGEGDGSGSDSSGSDPSPRRSSGEYSIT